MNRREVVLCVGMHRSGTSLTASLLEGLGVCLPGELIDADSANLSGYFENRSIVDAQERLLQDLGYWWPTERASRGMPASVVQQQVYSDYVDWLTNHLDELFIGGHGQIAVKDPRTSLLMPAWQEVAVRLRLSLRVVICVREPRDVCWSLVCRDGPSVGMTWSRAQRLWMGHYKNLLHGLGDLPAFVVRYEHWLEPQLAKNQINTLAKFVGRNCTPEQRRRAWCRLRPEFNHGGADQVPAVDRSLQRLHSSLVLQGTVPAGLVRHVDRYAASLELNRLRRVFRERLHVIWLYTPWGRRSMGAALDPVTLREQLGTTNLFTFRRRFRQEADLRPHPLISPAHLNRERLRLGLPPIQNAGDLFRYLLYPDLLQLNTHPWFDCREFQIQTGQLGKDVPHPVLSFLRSSSPAQISTYTAPPFQVPWLIALGAHLDRSNVTNLPEVISRLHPGLVLADPFASLGNPSDGREQLIAHEQYWSDIHGLFELWPESDPQGPLNWLAQQPNVAELGLTEMPPATGYQLWWVSGHWESQILGDLAGVDMSQSLEFPNPEALYEELLGITMGSSDSARPVLIALTAPLLELFFAGSFTLPDGVGFLNLVWPRPSQQSSWLHLLAQASLVVESRATVRAFFQGLGFKAEWPRAKKQNLNFHQLEAPILLLALESGVAEAQLAAAAPI